MRTIITIDYLEVNGINPDRKDLDRERILQSLESLSAKICLEMNKVFKKNKINAKIVSISD